MRFLEIAASATSGLVLCVVPFSAVGEELVTGAAIYEVSLDDTKAGFASDLAGLEGTMTVTLTRECRAYRSELDLATTIIGPDGEEVPMSMQSTHVEDETSLDFTLRGEFAMMEIERAKGVAVREGDEIAVSLEEPDADTLTVDGDVLFPMAMTRDLIAAAGDGERFIEYKLYDGSGFGREAWLVSVVIGEAGEDEEAEDTPFAAGLGFADMERWHMTFNYFTPEPADQMTPAFSTSAILYKNGFSQAAVYDFGQFAMGLKLVEFKPIAATPCP